jgi:hypothetical protein
VAKKVVVTEGELDGESVCMVLVAPSLFRSLVVVSVSGLAGFRAEEGGWPKRGGAWSAGCFIGWSSQRGFRHAAKKGPHDELAS